MPIRLKFTVSPPGLQAEAARGVQLQLASSREE
jgi:hypothetical protein